MNNLPTASENQQRAFRGGKSAGVVLTDVSKKFFHRRNKEWITAVEDVSLTLAETEFVCLVGPSGCGKSTVLNMVAGFESTTTGRLEVDGRPVDGPGPDRGVVFQEHGLFPWLTVVENVGFGPRVQKRKVTEPQILEVLALVGMEQFGGSYPHELSGGMRQRVALARALINEPQILLMDEPFGALDALTRIKMQRLLLGIISERPTAVMFITHDIEEAILLGDRILLMSAHPGRIIREIRVDSERPRDIGDPKLNEIKREITDLLLDD